MPGETQLVVWREAFENLWESTAAYHKQIGENVAKQHIGKYSVNSIDESVVHGVVQEVLEDNEKALFEKHADYLEERSIVIEKYLFSAHTH